MVLPTPPCSKEEIIGTIWRKVHCRKIWGQNSWQCSQHATWLRLLSSFLSPCQVLTSTRIVLLALLSGLQQSFRASSSQSSSSISLSWLNALFHVKGRWFPSRDQFAKGIAMTAILGSCSSHMLQKFWGSVQTKKKIKISSLKTQCWQNLGSFYSHLLDSGPEALKGGL